MPGTDAKYQHSPSTNLYRPCIECKKKRTLCIRARRKGNLGHALLSVHEPLADGSTATTTYGLWPKAGGTSRGSSDIRVNDSGDKYGDDPDAWNPKDVKCKEMDEKDEEKLKKALNKGEQYNFTSGNWCSTWASRTYNGVTGSNLSGFTPNSLANSINPPQLENLSGVIP